MRSEARAFRRTHPMLPSTPTSASAPHSTHIGTYHAAHPITVLRFVATVARVRHGCPCTAYDHARLAARVATSALHGRDFHPWVTIQSFRCYLLPL